MATQEILGQAKTVRDLLGVKYGVDYYQREYKWETKQIQELIEDLTNKFFDDYRPGHPPEEVAKYGHYFLGSVIVSRKDNTSFIVDGQQRLTSLTLLLMFLRNLQKRRADEVNIDGLIYSERFRKKSFNLDVPERTPIMEAIFDERPIDDADKSESVRNIVARYNDIAENFPEDLIGEALPYFIDWLTENVHLVEITAYSDDDAYTIFETMNDRGLSLSPTDMLKGFLLANITDGNRKTVANDRWKARVQLLQDVGKETDADFFKAWLRSQYAKTIRERTKSAKPGDFERIGTEFHRWVRDHADDRDDDALVLRDSSDYFNFIYRDFDFYSREYLRLMEAARRPVNGLEHVLYNAKQGFTLQYMLLLAPLRPDDPENVILLKQRLVAMFLDILLTRRVWNYHRNTYSSMYYGMFMTMRELRGLAPQALARKLYEVFQELQTQAERGLAFTMDLTMHQQNRVSLHLILARLTDYVEQGSGMPSHYMEYVNDAGKHRYEVEHIWANKPEEHADEIPDASIFRDRRNRLGGLLLLPKSFNAAFGALPYEEKLKHYNTQQNLLARSLHPDCYERNPGFLRFRERTGLPFKPHTTFKLADLEARQALYRDIAEQIWDPERLLDEVGV
jgi:hypothetical protein